MERCKLFHASPEPTPYNLISGLKPRAQGLYSRLAVVWEPFMGAGGLSLED